MPKFEDEAETAAIEARKAQTDQRQKDSHSCSTGHPEDKTETARWEQAKAKTAQGSDWAARTAASKGGEREI